MSQASPFPESTDEFREQQFADLLSQITDQMANGSDVNLEQACSQNPEFAEELRELWGTIAVTRAAGTNQSTTNEESKNSDQQLALELPYDLGNYVLQEEIGRGGMGIVYRAKTKADGTLVALKMILSGDFASEADRQRFRAEAEAAAQLDHPNIVPINEIGEHNGMPFYSMKFIEGQTLSDRLTAGPLPYRQASLMMQTISMAIQYAHDQGVLHRDIKPSNILIDEHGNPHLVDFGLAKQRSGGNTITNTGAVLGTPSYMSPEQAAGARGQICVGTDIYALGAVLYSSITGRPPFMGENPVDTVLMVIEQDPINPRVLNQRIPRDLEGIVLCCLQKPVDLRYSSAGQLSDDLEAFLGGRPVSAREGRFAQIIGQVLRETHHAGVLENWGVLWMWQGLAILIASVMTHSVYKVNEYTDRHFVSVWSLGLVLWAVVFWWLRRRMGPVTFVERQIAHVWAAGLMMLVFVYPIEMLIGLKPLDLAPMLALIGAMIFLIKAGILSGSFYIHSIALVLCAIAMGIFPDVAMLLFGITAALCFFLPGIKYYRRRKRNLSLLKTTN